jgi:hypothetical protein
MNEAPNSSHVSEPAVAERREVLDRLDDDGRFVVENSW